MLQKMRSASSCIISSSRQMDALLRRIEAIPSSAPEFPQLIRILARNFDNFPEKPLDGRSRHLNSA